MTLNFPLGYEGGAPAIITGRALATISGGQPVGISGGVGVVNASGTLSFDPATDLVFSPAATYASGLNFIGIATQYAASGAPVSVQINGAWVVRAANTVTANQTVAYTGDADGFVTSTAAGHVVGRALTGAASGGQFVVLLGK